MGGAYTAVDDDLAALGYNPAAYFVNSDKDMQRVTFFFNPVSPLIGGIKNSDIFQGEGSKFDDILLSLGLLMKSVSISIESLQIGLLLGEQAINLPAEIATNNLFSVDGFRQNHYHSLITRWRLADKVSLGGMASLIVMSDPSDPLKRQSKLGISYGILLRPRENLNVGVSFFNFPDTLKQFRLPLERMVDESVNIGISYLLPTGSRFSVDLRDLGEESDDVFREFHFGFEQTLVSQLALRVGFFRKRREGNVFSFGVGLFNGARLFNNSLNKYDNFMLNYAFVYEEDAVVDKKWHFLTISFRK